MKKRGITLITLIVSIIVITILAGTSILVIAGPDGMIARANKAAEEAEYYNATEVIRLSVIGSYDSTGMLNDERLMIELAKITTKITDKNGATIENSVTDLTNKYPIKVVVNGYEFEISNNGIVKGIGKESDTGMLEPGEIASSTKNKYQDTEGKVLEIPVGGMVSTVITQQNIKDGLVMIDVKGNQWVWVEVPESIFVNPVVKSKQDFDSIESNIKTYVSEYAMPTYGTYIYKDEWNENYTEIYETKEEYDTAKDIVLANIYSRNGFWVSRYEIGYENGIAVSKPDKSIYINQTIDEAQTSISDMNETSTLMFGFQWDLILKFMETKGGISPTVLKSESAQIGNYKDNINESIDGLAKAGESPNSEVLNINDIAGNVWEWTLETYSNPNTPYVYRGGNYSLDCRYFSAIKRYQNAPEYRNITIGSRAVFY